MIALIFLLSILIYLVIGRFVVKRIPSKWGKGIAIAVLILIPTGDEIVGRIYFNHMCTAEGGEKFYRTVELPAAYWDEQGRPKFFKENGDLNHVYLKNRFEEPHSTETYSKFFGIDKTHQKLVDDSNNKIVLGEVINFMYWGGWISRNFSPHNTATDCKEFHGNQFWHNFYVHFFKPSAQ